MSHHYNIRPSLQHIKCPLTWSSLQHINCPPIRPSLQNSNCPCTGPSLQHINCPPSRPSLQHIKLPTPLGHHYNISTAHPTGPSLQHINCPPTGPSLQHINYPPTGSSLQHSNCPCTGSSLYNISTTHPWGHHYNLTYQLPTHWVIITQPHLCSALSTNISLHVCTNNNCSITKPYYYAASYNLWLHVLICEFFITQMSEWLSHMLISCWLHYCQHKNSVNLTNLNNVPFSNVNISNKQQS